MSRYSEADSKEHNIFESIELISMYMWRILTNQVKYFVKYKNYKNKSPRAGLLDEQDSYKHRIRRVLVSDRSCPPSSDPLCVNKVQLGYTHSARWTVACRGAL